MSFLSHLNQILIINTSVFVKVLKMKYFRNKTKKQCKYHRFRLVLFYLSTHFDGTAGGDLQNDGTDIY